MATINIKVRQQSFKISCASGEEEMMRHAATLVGKKIEEVQKRTGVADGERVAIMAALMLVHENNTATAANTASKDDKTNNVNKEDKKLIDKMNNDIDAALIRTKPLRGRLIT